MVMMKKLLSVLVLTFAFIAGCNNDNETIQNCVNVACTEEFRTIFITLKDGNNAPIALDSFKIIAIKSNLDLTREINSSVFALMQQKGIYPLFGDEYAKTYQNKELEIEFRGFKDDLQTVTERFVVAADCCHVFLVSGSTELIL